MVTRDGDHAAVLSDGWIDEELRNWGRVKGVEKNNVLRLVMAEISD